MDRHLHVTTPTPPRPIQPAGRSVIAVIGVDQYEDWPRLHNAVNDARGAAQLFAQLGFAAVTAPLLDGAATGDAMRRLVTNDLAQLAPDDSLVVFFAGHGHTHAVTFDDVTVKTGYVIPVDAAPPERRDAASWLRLDSWLSDIARLPPRHILVIVDACNSGVALSELHKWRGEATDPGGLAALQSRRSRCVITSALDDQRAADGGPFPGHSLFTGCLLEGLSGSLARDGRRVATGREIGQYLQSRVRSYPHTSQTPDFGAFELDDRGDIVVPILDAGTPNDVPEPAAAPLPPPAPPAPATLPSPPLPSTARDVSYELPTIAITGAVHEPQALLEPWVPHLEISNAELDAPGANALENQRLRVAGAADPVQRRAEAIVLAALFYLEARRYDVTKLAMAEQARGVLREVLRDAGTEADAIALRLLGACDVLAQDYPAAETTWQALLVRSSNEDDAAYCRAWLAYAQLRQHACTAALATVTGQPLTSHPELAYVAAWACWNTGDTLGAWQAIAAAAQGWRNAENPQLTGKQPWTRLSNNTAKWGYADPRSFEDELLLFASYADIPPEQTAQAIVALREYSPPPTYEDYMGIGLGGYGPRGRWAHGLAVLQRAVEGHNDAYQLWPTNRVAIASWQADFAARLDLPELAARHAERAVDGLALCEQATNYTPEFKAEIVRRIHALGELFFELYTATEDPSYGQPAFDLHAMILPLLSNGATQARAQRRLAAIEAILTRPWGLWTTLPPERDQAAMHKVIALHNAEIQACFEVSLSNHPQRSGTVALEVEADETGAITRVSVAPAITGDLVELASAVAGRVSQWKLPRCRERTRRLRLSYAFAPGDPRPR